MKRGLLAAQPERKLTGQAANQQRARLVREDVFEAVVSILGRDLILSKVCAAHGPERAEAVAEVLRLNADAWREQHDTRVRATTQSTMYERPSSAYHEDARHHPLVTAAVLRGAGMDEINSVIAEASELIRAEQTGRRTTGPDHPAESTRAPRQRTLISSNPAAAYNADQDDSAQQPAPRRVSVPPGGLTATPREA